MVAIMFPDRNTQVEALGFLASHFSGRAFRTGEVIIPEAALEALVEQNFSFQVIGKATYEQMASFRGNAASKPKRRRTSKAKVDR